MFSGNPFQILKFDIVSDAINKALALESSNTDQAIIEYSRAISLAEKNKHSLLLIAYSLRGKCFYKMGIYPSSIADFSYLIEHINSPFGLFCRSFAFAKLKKYDLARSDLVNGMFFDRNGNVLTDQNKLIIETWQQIESAVSQTSNFIYQADSQSKEEKLQSALKIKQLSASLLLEENLTNSLMYGSRSEEYFKIGDVEKSMDDLTVAIWMGLSGNSATLKSDITELYVIRMKRFILFGLIGEALDDLEDLLESLNSLKLSEFQKLKFIDYKSIEACIVKYVNSKEYEKILLNSIKYAIRNDFIISLCHAIIHENLEVKFPEFCKLIELIPQCYPNMPHFKKLLPSHTEQEAMYKEENQSMIKHKILLFKSAMVKLLSTLDKNNNSTASSESKNEVSNNTSARKNKKKNKNKSSKNSTPKFNNSNVSYNAIEKKEEHAELIKRRADEKAKALEENKAAEAALKEFQEKEKQEAERLAAEKLNRLNEKRKQKRTDAHKAKLKRLEDIAKEKKAEADKEEARKEKIQQEKDKLEKIRLNREEKQKNIQNLVQIKLLEIQKLSSKNKGENKEDLATVNDDSSNVDSLEDIEVYTAVSQVSSDVDSRSNSPIMTIYANAEEKNDKRELTETLEDLVVNYKKAILGDFPEKAYLDAIINIQLQNKTQEPLTFIVGGFPRNAYGQIKSKTDIDIVTNATKEEIRSAFKGAVIKEINQTFGDLFIIKLPGNIKIEVTRSKKLIETEGTSKQKLIADANSRDFRVNTFYINNEAKLYAPIPMAITDLENKKVETITDAFASFSEDPLRILRAIDLESRGFTLSDNVIKAIELCSELILKKETANSINASFSKLMINGRSRKNFNALCRLGTLNHLFPNLLNHVENNSVWLSSHLDLTDQSQRRSLNHVYMIFAASAVLHDMNYWEDFPNLVANYINNNVLLSTNFSTYKSENFELLRHKIILNWLNYLGQFFSQEVSFASTNSPLANNSIFNTPNVTTEMINPLGHSRESIGVRLPSLTPILSRE